MGSTLMMKKMKPANRQSKTLDLIRENGRVDVKRLAEHFGASEETIRRDLSALANAGKVRKIHGGAEISQVMGEGSFQQRMGENVVAKRRIGKEAAKLFSPGDTIFIDTGSTTLYFAEEIATISNLTVITNSALVAKVIGKGRVGSRVFLLGGEYNWDNQETFGTLLVEQIQAFRAHYVVLAIGALDGATGVMDFNINEAQVAHAMIKKARSVIVLADHTKFDSIASFGVCGLDEVTKLVCDQPPETDLLHALLEHDVSIMVAKE